MLVLYCINLFKLEIFWLSKKVKMIYNLERRKYMLLDDVAQSHRLVYLPPSVAGSVKPEKFHSKVEKKKKKKLYAEDLFKIWNEARGDQGNIPAFLLIKHGDYSRWNLTMTTDGAPSVHQLYKQGG